MKRSGRSGFFPVQRGEFRDTLAGPVGDFRQHVEEILAHVDAVALAGFENRCDGGDLDSGFRASDVQPVFATEGQRTHPVFAPVVIDLDTALVKENFQSRPQAQRIWERIA